jgi:lipid-binding SYLF domain-containing protein
MAGDKQFEQANLDATVLLKELDAASAKINSSFLARCDAVLLQWSIKAGLVLGFETGSGFVIRRLGEGRWSAPLFVSATAMRAGAIAGVEKVATVALSLTRDLTEQLQEGRSPQLGADISLRLGTAVEADGESFSLPIDDVDLLTYSVAVGSIVDVSLKGGALSADAAKNVACYGEGVTSRAILSGSVAPPPQLQPLYSRLSELASN